MSILRAKDFEKERILLNKIFPPSLVMILPLAFINKTVNVDFAAFIVGELVGRCFCRWAYLFTTTDI